VAVPTDNIETTTLRLIRRRLADNIFKANGTLAYLLSRGRVKTARGGRFIAEPLIYATNNTVQSYRGYDRLNVTPTQELTEAQYNWRLAAASISMSGEEDLINNGPEQVFDLTKAKVKVAEMSLKQYYDEKIHASVATKDTDKDILGFDEMMDDDGTFSTFGGIDATAETWWENQLGPGGTTLATINASVAGTGTVASPVAIATSSNLILSQVMNRMYHNCSRGLTQPDLITTAQAVYERYENDALDKLRLTDTSMADLGFENIKFKGATMMWNENVQTSSTDFHPMYFTNSEFMSFTLHERRNFVISEFVSPWDQDAKVAQILAAGNLTCSNRRHQGVCWVDLSP